MSKKKKRDPRAGRPTKPPDSQHDVVSRKLEIEVWTVTVGDAGVLFDGVARIGAHQYRTQNYDSTRTGALIAALGLIQAHLAGVAIRYGDLRDND